MTDEELVRTVYPDAVVFSDLHNYGNREGGKLQYLILCNVPKELLSTVKEGIICLDFLRIKDDIHVWPLGVWCDTIEEAWKLAWISVQDHVRKTLDE
jgi:hypothetical protein